MRQPGSQPESQPASEPTAWALGIDVSYFDESIDWEMVKKVGTTPPGSRRVARSGHGTSHHNSLAVHGVDFAFIRATDPDLRASHHHKDYHGVDPKFRTNWHEAREAGVICGPYHFFRPEKEVAAQVELFVSTVGSLEADDLPPVLDLEVAGHQPDEVIVERTQEWLQAVEKHFGRKPIIYVSPGFWNAHMLGQQHSTSHHRRHHHHPGLLPGNSNPDPNHPDPNHPAPQDVFSQYPLWIASYRSHPQLPQHTWQDWTFWQYTAHGKVRGIGSVHHPPDVDCDVFHCTVDQLKEFAKKSITGGSGSSQVSKPPQPAPDKTAPPNPQPPAPEKAPKPQTAPDAATPPAGTRTYTVQSGDTLDGIARQLGVSAAALAAANKIDDPNLIRVGQVLTIP